MLTEHAIAVPSVVTGSLESEVTKVFKKSQGGYFFDSDTFTKVIKSTKNLVNKRELSHKIGENAREYIVENFSSSKVLLEFRNRIEKLL